MAERLSSLAFAQSHYFASESPPDSHAHAPSQYRDHHVRSHSQHSSSRSSQQDTGFNPRSVSFDVRTPEELAAVNEFLIALGRNVTNTSGSGAGPASSHSLALPSQRQHHSHPLTPTEYSLGPGSGRTHNGNASPASYFDSAGLAQLGLSNMPGIPTLHSPGPSLGSTGASYEYERDYDYRGGYASSSTPPHRPSSGSGSGLYPPFETHAHSKYAHPQTISLGPSSVSSGSTSISSSASSPASGAYAHGPGAVRFRPTPPLSASPVSAYEPDGAARFSSLARSASGGSGSGLGMGLGAASAGAALGVGIGSSTGAAFGEPQLGTYEYVGSRALRTVVPLKSIPGRASKGTESDDENGEDTQGDDIDAPARTRYVLPPPGPMEPRLRTGIQRGPPAKLASSTSPSLSSSSLPSKTADSPYSAADVSPPRKSLYPLLTAGDAEFRLPPLVGKGARAGVRTHPRSSASGSSSNTSALRSTYTYPSISAYASGAKSTYSDEESEGSEGSRTPSPAPGMQVDRSVVLPSLRSIAAHELDEGTLARGVSRLRLSPGRGQGRSLHATAGKARAKVDVTPEERRMHAELIRDLLVSINTDYRRRFGTPPRVRREESPRDTEMVA